MKTICKLKLLSGNPAGFSKTIFKHKTIFENTSGVLLNLLYFPIFLLRSFEIDTDGVYPYKFNFKKVFVSLSYFVFFF